MNFIMHSMTDPIPFCLISLAATSNPLALYNPFPSYGNSAADDFDRILSKHRKSQQFNG